jgi:hypothetical protein
MIITPYNHETDETPELGVFIEADSLEEAEEKLRELGREDLPLLMTNDPSV